MECCAVMLITDFLDTDRIRLALPSTTSEDVIRELGGLLLGQGRVTDGFIDATLAREATMPTGLPLGGKYNVAIPHVDVEYVTESSLALATLPEPVVFRNMVDPDDEVPVRLVIMLALNQPKSQVEMLSSIANLFQNNALVEQIVNAGSAEDVMELLNSVNPS